MSRRTRSVVASAAAVLVVALLTAALQTRATAAEADATHADAGADAADARHEVSSAHFAATTLLDDVHESHFEDAPLAAATELGVPSKAEVVAAARKEIAELSSRLLADEVRVSQRRAEREAAKGSAFWFLDKDARGRVHAKQLALNDELRQVSRTHEQIAAKWLEVKPLYGVWSLLFLQEVMSFVPYMAYVAWEALEALVALGLVSILVAGPLFFVAASLMTFAFWLPLMVGVPCFLLTVYWLVDLPFVIATYNPEVWEFCAVYFPLVALIVFIQVQLLRWMLPSPGTVVWRSDVRADGDDYSSAHEHAE